MIETAAPFTVQEYAVVHKISRILIDGGDVRADLYRTLTVMNEDLKMERGMISVLVQEEEELKLDVSLGLEDDEENVSYLLGEGVTGKVVSEGRPALISKISEEPKFLDRTGLRKNLDREEIAFLCVPIRYGNKVVGSLSVDHATPSHGENLDVELQFLEEVASMLASRVHARQEEIRNRSLSNGQTQRLGKNFVGNSDAMRELSMVISKVADSSTSVLITGETGTGKEVVAREIHERSPRRGAPLIKVNCGAIPENLIESELFGHEKGAFTGAMTQRKGRFEMSRGGTIFLDEIGELPANAQVKLLRVLQEREFERVGGHETVKINVRVIAATNRSLEEEVQEGNFRADLYYRLNVFPVHAPALRERGADIMLLADHFIQRFAEELGKPVSRIDTPAIDMLMAYHWPGNVRELENTVERAILLSDDGVIHGHHLPPSLQMKEEKTTMIVEQGKFETLVQNYERQLIIEALKESWGNQTEASRILGTTKRVVQYKIQKLGIDYRRYSRNGRVKDRTGI
jgi:Nif-specific regulatory protein